MPCSSGSSELWFASKIFTGEEVVVKKVAEGREVAFERERTVLKVGVWLLAAPEMFRCSLLLLPLPPLVPPLVLVVVVVAVAVALAVVGI